MENFFSRYRNETVLVAVLFVQLIMLATQIKVHPEVSSSRPGGTRLIRVWAVGMIAPFERLGVYSGNGVRTLWHGYVDLRHIRNDNQQLVQQIDQLRLEQVRMREDAAQGQRLQKLLDFKSQFPSQTIAAQVIGTSGTDTSRVLYIDKGTRAGIRNGMAVITPDGIAGKILRADGLTSQVLLITDPSSGAGVILERTRLNGVLKGTSSGKTEVVNVMSDEDIRPGDKIVTSGGDRVFPKGLAVGTVAGLRTDEQDGSFLDITVKPAVDLTHLEEVLVVTQVSEPPASQNAALEVSPTHTVDMLAQRLPSAKKPAEVAGKPPAIKAEGGVKTAAAAFSSGMGTVSGKPNTGGTVRLAQPKPKPPVKSAPEKPESLPPSETETPR